MSEFSTNSSVKQVELFNRLLEVYKGYFEVENRVAYLEGRAFKIIGKFLSVLLHLLMPRTQLELDLIEQRIQRLKTATKQFETECRKSYPDLFPEVESTQNTQYSHVPYQVLSQHAWFMAHMELALLLWRQRFGEKADPEITLIEFNNYLSHLVAGGSVSDTTGIGHLNRAALDLCKEILLADVIKMMSCRKRVNDFVTLRKKESVNVGARYDDKKQIVKDYLDLTQGVLGY